MVRQALGFDLWAMTDARHIAEDAAAIDDDDDQARRGAETSAAATSAPIVAPTTKSNRRGNKRSQVTCVTATRPSKRIVFVRHGHAESNAGTGRFPWVVDVAVRVGGFAQTMTVSNTDPTGYEVDGYSAYRRWEFFDAPLTDRGKAQAASLTGFFRDAGCELLVSSPLTRALQTGLIAVTDPETGDRAVRLEGDYP